MIDLITEIEALVLECKAYHQGFTPDKWIGFCPICWAKVSDMINAHVSEVILAEEKS